MVLYGAAKKQALKSDYTTVLLLEVLTVLDLLITLFSVLPVTLTIIAGDWILGPVLCLVNAALTRYLYSTELLVVSFLSLHRLRLVMIRRGKRGSIRRRKQQRVTRNILIFIMILPLVPLLVAFFCSPHKVTFVPAYMSCVVPEMPRVWENILLTFLVLPR